MKRIALFLLFSLPCFAQITIDNTGKAAAASNASSVTITTFAVGAGSNRLLRCGISWWTANARTVSTVKFNTTGTLSKLTGSTSQQAAYSGFYNTEIWYMVAPANATASVVVTMSGATEELIAGCDSWTGVSQTAPFGTPVLNNAATGSPTVTVSSAAGEVVVDVAAWDRSNGGAGSVGAGQTSRWKTQNSTTGTAGAGSSEAGAASVTMTWTTSTAFWCNTAVAIKPPAAAASSVFRRGTTVQ